MKKYIFIFCFIFTQYSFAMPICQRADSDSDGDGWGWENNESCQVVPGVTPNTPNQPVNENTNAGQTAPDAPSGTPACRQADSDPDGDGWGWEDGQSCRVIAGTTPNAANQTQNENTNSVEQNENTNSAGQTAPSTPACQQANSDPDGDGWGWENGQSCRVIAGTTPNGSNQAQNENTVPENTVPENTVPENNNQTSTPTNIGNGSGTPVTLPPTQASGQSCTRAPSGSSFVSRTASLRNGSATRQCVDSSRIFSPALEYGDFYFLNNAWNSQASTANWNQCISLNQNRDGSLSPRWDYDWADEYDIRSGLREWEVKTYPEVIFGVKRSDQRSGDCNETGLPAQYADLPNFTIDFAYTSTHTQNRVGTIGVTANDTPYRGGERNVAIESFFHTSCNVSRGEQGLPNNVVFEMMVWLEKGTERLPSGQPPVGQYTDTQGRTYDIYTKPNENRGYIAFVSTDSPTNLFADGSGTLNWNEFVNYTRTNGAALGVTPFNDSWCMANIIFGTEIWWGQGAFDLHTFNVRRNY